MVDDLLPLIQGHPDQGLSRDLPFAFYGHSLGGLVAFELTRRLQLEGMPTPERLLIGASVPPHMGLIHPRIEHLSDEQFVEAMQERYAGIPAAVLQEPELLELFLPVLRTDFAAYEGYEFEETGRVRCPLTAFAGAEDFAVTERVMSEWSRHTSSQFELRVVPGDHFFLSASRDRLLGYVREDLRRAIEIGLSDSLLNAGKS
jgi:medium-chain acyl-[acyl-carrier-protein] hydrolase